jgi:hypothetical protein
VIQSGGKTASETERVRRLMDKGAPRYDRQMNFFDRALFGGGREWACSKAEGDVLEIAVGSGRNLPFYGAVPDAPCTSTEFAAALRDFCERGAKPPA